jgi:hypothetical protein
MLLFYLGTARAKKSATAFSAFEVDNTD